MTVAYQAPPSMEFSRQLYWSGLPFPLPSEMEAQLKGVLDSVWVWVCSGLYLGLGLGAPASPTPPLLSHAWFLLGVGQAFYSLRLVSPLLFPGLETPSLSLQPPLLLAPFF